MFRSIVALVCLLPSLLLFASEGHKPAYPSFDYQVARDHEIKPHRRAIPVVGMGEEYTSHQLHLELTVSPTGDVTHAEAINEDGDTRFWPQLESEVYRWKFTPFEAGGKPVTAMVQEYIDLVPPERLPKTHIPPPVITKDSKVAITLLQWMCDGPCPLHSVTVSTDGIVFEGFNVATRGRHTDKIDNDAVIALAKRLVAADFYSMEDDYRYRGWDTLSSSLSITIDGHTKRVRDYEGQWVGMPSVIVELEDEVDAVAHTDRWIGGGDGLVAALRAEKFDFTSYDAQVILYETAARGQTTTVRELLAAGVPLKPLPAPTTDNPYGGPFGKVRLLTAASRHPDTLRVFLDLGASKEDQEDKDRALDGAASAGKLEAVRALIAYGANPNVDFSKLWSTGGGLFSPGATASVAVGGEGAGSVLIDAARSGNPDVVKEILRYGPKLEARDRKGKTAIFVAGVSTNSDGDGRSVECVRVLAKAGARVDARDKDGNTPLHKGYLLDVEEELLKLGADVNARNHDGETPIFTIMNDRVIPLFLQHGADLTIRNNRGETVMDARTGRGSRWDEALREAIAQMKHPQ
ncbi:ankyrin repeat domain-containing protein [Tunturiibacter psychrotolerans]|uniref:ankyrin repeat domain-containing protein n=1 Tax=Tunturiibacter psychrotolerans TaxID=3069686 RepID=UPI003D1B367E